MHCADVERLLDAYRDHELAVPAAQAVREHLDTCPTCRRLLTEREALSGLVRKVGDGAAPDRLRERIAASLDEHDDEKADS
jgi:Predicted transmembrane transcriptional regulator (anti-sigma factor)